MKKQALKFFWVCAFLLVAMGAHAQSTAYRVTAQGTVEARAPVAALSIDFSSIDVATVVGIISDFSGVKITPADSVRGTISINVQKTPWDQALNKILREKGLEAVQTQDGIRVRAKGRY